MEKKPINIQSKIRLCPLLSVAFNNKSNCVRFECMWFVESSKDLGTPNQCAIAAINRNILDTWLTLDKVRLAVTDD